ncbi:chemotaxis protein CheW [Sphingomonas sp. 2SG]|uniref:chemotaxis protein CheW n=1 Tax=Sphingomonas sp. 2SG TaxID=2502201 RepID=UPI0010F59DD7|nr:chemotaxis protein CheW [Sphingomonas sp. 2SG]
MTDSTPLPWTADGTLEVLSFGVGGETFAIEAVLVQEILDLMPETAVPGADPLVGHVINFRGRVIPLADLRRAFDMTPADTTRDNRIVVIERPVGETLELIGLRADRVNEVTTLSSTDCEAAPAIGMRWRRDHIRGLIQHHGEIVVLPDLDAIFATVVH